MAHRKLLTVRPITFRIAWAGFVGAYLVLLLLPESIAGTLAWLTLAAGAFAILVSIFCAAMLVILYRWFFAQWRGVAICVVTLGVGRWTTATGLMTGRAQLAVLVLTLDAMLVLGICLALMLWKRDAGLPLVGWALVGFIWTMLIVNRVQGDIVEVLLRSMGNASIYPTWWLDPFFCFLWWAVPLGVLSFLWHTLRLIRKEVHGANKTLR